MLARAVAATSILLGCGDGGGVGEPPVTPVATLQHSTAVSSTSAPSITVMTLPNASTSTPARPIPRTIGPADDGAVFTMDLDTTAGLVIPDPLADDPQVDGTSLEVVEIVNIDASGQREWELRALRPGRTVLASPTAPAYVITIDVVAEHQ